METPKLFAHNLDDFVQTIERLVGHSFQPPPTHRNQKEQFFWELRDFIRVTQRLPQPGDTYNDRNIHAFFSRLLRAFQGENRYYRTEKAEWLRILSEELSPSLQKELWERIGQSEKRLITESLVRAPSRSFESHLRTLKGKRIIDVTPVEDT